MGKDAAKEINEILLQLQRDVREERKLVATFLGNLLIFTSLWFVPAVLELVVRLADLEESRFRYLDARLKLHGDLPGQG
ncbi:MAG TPA: hypothetical protein VN493_22180 [Thermoanaerobaculia bacterium]|nr:hypothetical protein [Thermoanaerobaculia bacterium]